MRVMVGEIVAEKSAVWRSVGRRRQDRLEVVREAHVEHLVGLVEDDHADRVEAEAAALEVVDRAAGRGDDDVDAAPQAAQLLADRLAAVDRQDAGAEARGRTSWSASATCIASSRVGTRTSADVLPSAAWPIGMRWSVGSANAAVLPVPVGASASRSRPASSGGIASRWMGVGSS